MMNIIYSIHFGAIKEVTRRAKHKKVSRGITTQISRRSRSAAAASRIKNCIEKSSLSARADFPKGQVGDKKEASEVSCFSQKFLTNFQSPWKRMTAVEKSVSMKILMYAANFSAFVILLWLGWQLWSGGFKVHLFFPFFASTRMSTFNGVGDE